MIEKLLNDTTHNTLSQQNKDKKGSSEAQQAADSAENGKEAEDKEMESNNNGPSLENNNEE